MPYPPGWRAAAAAGVSAVAADAAAPPCAAASRGFCDGGHCFGVCTAAGELACRSASAALAPADVGTNAAAGAAAAAAADRKPGAAAASPGKIAATAAGSSGFARYRNAFSRSLMRTCACGVEHNRRSGPVLRAGQVDRQSYGEGALQVTRAAQAAETGVPLRP